MSPVLLYYPALRDPMRTVPPLHDQWQWYLSDKTWSPTFDSRLAAIDWFTKQQETLCP